MNLLEFYPADNIMQKVPICVSKGLRNLIIKFVPGARTILDVAYGTGEHAKFLKHHYAVDGIDLNENYLRAARLKNRSGNYSRADMMDFDLGRTYDEQRKGRVDLTLHIIARLHRKLNGGRPRAAYLSIR